MTTPQTPVDAMMALVDRYWELAYAEGKEGRDHDTEAGEAQAVLSEIRSSARALAAIPAEPDALGYATRLAQAIFDKHFAHAPHYASSEIVWRPLDDLLGVLTQIDNMVAGIAQQAGGVPAGFVEAQALAEVAGCFDAAMAEGLLEALAETADLRLKDLVERRLMFAHAVAAQSSPSPSAVQPLSEAQITVLRFLDGVGGLRGFHFGEKPPTVRGNYWWRKDLRAAFPDVDFGIVTKEST